jgi:hypothetical protein
MLKFSTLQTHALAVALSSDEDQKLRLAFGRFAKQPDRKAGEGVVSLHYEKKRCFHCDCRPDASKPPMLFLITGTHIRRETDGKGTPHDEGCDFAREPDEQKRLVRSYQRPPDEYRLNLVRKFSEAKVGPPSMAAVTTKRSRPTLAKVLCSLLHEAHLDRFFSTTPLHGNRDQQIGDLLNAAEKFTLAPGRPLKHWLATSLRDYYRLKERLNHSMATWKRPYGLFIETFDRIENNTLYPKRTDLKPLHVTGRLTVFGEGEELRRSPYLVIGLLSQPSRKAKSVELLNAYAHPCVAWDRLTLVDSKLERETLALLISCRDWLAKNHNVTFTIEKPQFDKGPDESDNPRELCLPDFLLHPKGEKVARKDIVIETMGFNDTAYRERKLRIRPLFEQIGKLIEHDRFQPNKTAKEIDRDFRRSVCAAIIGNRLLPD